MSATETRQINGAEAIALQVGHDKYRQYWSLFQKTLEHFGKLDILVNNAAGKNLFQATAEMTEQEYNSIIGCTDRSPLQGDRAS
jgi:3-oxoacyl-[acyl-carrier protein] reductase